jgi:hypothetical protein
MIVVSILIIAAGAGLWWRGVSHLDIGSYTLGLLIILFGSGCLASSIMTRVLS